MICEVVQVVSDGWHHFRCFFVSLLVIVFFSLPWPLRTVIRWSIGKPYEMVRNDMICGVVNVCEPPPSCPSRTAPANERREGGRGSC